jgi:DNA/RNA-binding domain of Phe-tRNA-synthetase-like protein
MWSIEANLPIRLAVIEIEGVTVSNDKAGFERLKECAQLYKSKYEGTPIGSVDGIQFARDLFRNIGIDPTKHRPASEALLNRALKEKELYSVNTLVDVGNWCSLDFPLPTCVFDADKIKGDVKVRKGKQGESYIGLNNRPVNLSNRYLITDETGAFGSPMTDSQRTAVNPDTKRAILIIYAPKDYDTNLLREQANLFAQRAIDICKGKLKNIQILP